jgi:hypothetical protein
MLAPNEQASASTPANKRSTTDADTIAHLRAQLAMTAVPAPSSTTPASALVAPVHTSTATELPPSRNFNRDMMATMSNILPGNDAVQDIINKHTTHCIKVKDGEHPPVEVQHEDNKTYITDTATISTYARSYG